MLNTWGYTIYNKIDAFTCLSIEKSKQFQYILTHFILALERTDASRKSQNLTKMLFNVWTVIKTIYKSLGTAAEVYVLFCKDIFS